MRMTKTVLFLILCIMPCEASGATMEGVSFPDRYSLTYEVGRGTELALNGTPKGVIGGADFAAAMFSIWIGPHPLNESLRSALLGVP